MINKERIKLLPLWCVTNEYPAFYDTESKTAIEMVARLYGSMREMQEDYNKYANEVNKTITDFINNIDADQEEFKNHITKIVHDYIAMLDEKIKQQDQVIEDSIIYIKNNLKQSVADVLNEMKENGELDEVVLNIFNNLNERVETLETNKTYLQYNEELKEVTLIINEKEGEK